MSDTTDRFEGGCLCGAVRFVATGPPKGVAWCHCESCRKHSGAPVSVFVAFEHTAYTVTEGEISKLESTPGKTKRGFLCSVWIDADLRNGRPAHSDGFPCRCVRSCRTVSPYKAHISGGAPAVAPSCRHVKSGQRSLGHLSPRHIGAHFASIFAPKKEDFRAAGPTYRRDAPGALRCGGSSKKTPLGRGAG